MITISVKRNYAEILQWLIKNVGPLLHSQPIIFWHGSGWHMTRVTLREVDINRFGDYGYAIRIDDQEKAVWFSLIWE